MNGIHGPTHHAPPDCLTPVCGMYVYFIHHDIRVTILSILSNLPRSLSLFRIFILVPASADKYSTARGGKVSEYSSQAVTLSRCVAVPTKNTQQSSHSCPRNSCVGKKVVAENSTIFGRIGVQL